MADLTHGLIYNAPAEGQESSINGASTTQFNTFVYLRKAIIDAKKEQYFLPLASSTSMPKHYGKKIKLYQYVPLLDDRNVNDQGIDASGATIRDGNLYGSSKDIGKITSKLPLLSETGGRVNRVGFTRLEREGSIFKMGFFYEFTQEALDFDTDDGLLKHLARELLNGASEIVEDVLQRDLLGAAGVVEFPGGATTDSEVTGEGANATILDYKTLMRVDQVLTDNRCPRKTTIIKGSNFNDTKTLPACRVAYVGSELVYTLKSMKDLFGNKAVIEVQHYADAANVLNGEIGSIDHIRFVQVPEMLHWEGAGAPVTDHSTAYRNDGKKYNIYPVLIVGDDSFSTIGFQTNGKSVGFSVNTKMPGPGVADRNDPYGETGFSSIKFWYGFLCQRPERIAVIKCVATI